MTFPDYVPPYVTAANTISASIYYLATTKSTILSAGCGAALGYSGGKTATHALLSAVTDLYWKYITPYTFEKVFMHEKSNFQARALGALLSYAASFTIPYIFVKCVLPFIKETTSCIGQLKKENNLHPFEIPEALCISTIVLGIDMIRTMYKVHQS